MAIIKVRKTTTVATLAHYVRALFGEAVHSHNRSLWLSIRGPVVISANMLISVLTCWNEALTPSETVIVPSAPLMAETTTGASWLIVVLVARHLASSSPKVGPLFTIGTYNGRMRGRCVSKKHG